MTIDGLARVIGGSNDLLGIAALKKGLEHQDSQMGQLLQSLPQAPGPAHLGRSVNVLA